VCGEIPPFPQYVFMVKHGDNFTFTFHLRLDLPSGLFLLDFLTKIAYDVNCSISIVSVVIQISQL
jgi:hypothetical protein